MKVLLCQYLNLLNRYCMNEILERHDHKEQMNQQISECVSKKTNDYKKDS